MTAAALVIFFTAIIITTTFTYIRTGLAVVTSTNTFQTSSKHRQWKTALINTTHYTGAVIIIIFFFFTATFTFIRRGFTVITIETVCSCRLFHIPATFHCTAVPAITFQGKAIVAITARFKSASLFSQQPMRHVIVLRFAFDTDIHGLDFGA